MDRWHWGRKKRVDLLVGGLVALRFRKMDMASHRSPVSVGTIAFRSGGRVVSVGAVGGLGRLCRSVLVCAGVANESQVMVGTNLAERERERENLSLPLSRSDRVRFGWADPDACLFSGKLAGSGWPVGLVVGDSCLAARFCCAVGSGLRPGPGEVLLRTGIFWLRRRLRWGRQRQLLSAPRVLMTLHGHFPLGVRI